MSGEEALSVKALRVLSEVPLCDRCMGRLFARLGHGWGNDFRGRSLKAAAVMEAHRLLREGVEGARVLLRRVALNAGPVADGVVRGVLGEEPGGYPACRVCGGRLDRVIESASREAKALLRAYDVERFVVGVRVEDDTLEREEEIRLRYGLPYGESLRAELRREVGKRLREAGFQPDFDDPEATVLVYFPSGRVELQVSSLFLRGRYWKLARYISQAYWPSPTGPRYFSMEQAAWGLLRVTGGESLVIHAAGREDVDARMLGTGRPLVIEVKAPRRRRIPLGELEEAANREARGLVEFRIEGLAGRREVRMYKSELAKSRKTYKALVAFEEEVGDGDLERLAGELRGRVILQRTPRRVLHRRPDILRRRRVYDLACRRLAPQVAECIIEAEGGLYVKELVSGDEGRTTPSFSEILGFAAECVELDVIAVVLEPPAATA